VSPSLGRAALAAALLTLASTKSWSQDPVRLPEMIVKANIDKPGAKKLVGLVVDTGGVPIPDAEVTIPGLARRLFTRGDGTFRFDSIPKGKYSMRARKLGFAPQVRVYEVDSTGGVATFALLPIVRELPSMLTTAGKRGISGHVEDMNYASLPGATVKLLGQGMTTTTDQGGDFFFPAEPGRYMLSIARDSFTTKLVGVTVPKDSGRHVNAWLMASFGRLPKEQFWNVADLGERQAWVRPQDKVLFTREDLARLKIEWIYDAVATTTTKFRQTEPYSRDCMVVVNGGPDIVDLSTLTIDDVETVEVYAGYAGSAPSVSAINAKGELNKKIVNPFIWLSNARFAVIENQTRHCPGVNVWLR
jgi:hypothetical protein